MVKGKPHTTIFIIALLVVMRVHFAYAQVEQPNRYELERKFSDQDFTIISLKKEGLALIREKNKYKSGNRTWEVILLDTLVQEKAKIDIDIDNQNRLVGYEYSAGEVHFLFHKNELKGYLDLLSLNVKTKTINHYEIKAELTFQLTHFYKVGQNFIFAGIVSREPAILLYNTVADNLKVLPGLFQKQTALLDIQVNQNQTFNTFLIDRSNRDDQKVIFRTHDSSGKLLLEDITTIDRTIELHNGICSTLEKEDLIVLGNWGKLNSKQASGFYALPINPFTEQTITRNYFGQLDHYLDYLKPKKAAAVKAKTARALEEGKIPDFTNYTIPYKIIEHAQGFLLLAESFQPTSSQQSTQSPYDPSYYPYYTSPYGYQGIYPTGPSSYNRIRTYNRDMVTEEMFKPIQTVVVSFNASGSVQWDQSMKFDDLKLNDVGQVADFQLDKDSIRFLYKKESEIRTKSINLDDGESVERNIKIKLSNVHDEIRMERSYDGQVKYWFDNNFYVWGYQTIRNKTGGEYKTREVFYINKVTVY